MLYFAYGMNLDMKGMRERCPKAKPINSTYMLDSQLVFRGVADCPYVAGQRCWGGVWRITQACERRLDQLESFYPDNPTAGLYRKEYVVNADGEQVMYYVMNRDRPLREPVPYYYDVIERGYGHFGLPLEALQDARAAAKEVSLSYALSAI